MLYNLIKRKLNKYHEEVATLSMASITFFLLLFSTVAAQQRQSNISRGSSLTPTINSSWLSPSGLYAFGFYPRGNGYSIGIFLAGIPQKTVVWTANRNDPPVSTDVTLLFTTDGWLVLQSTEGDDTPIISQSASSASMSDSGNFVLYNSARNIVWQSFDYPTDTLLPTQRFKAGTNLVSSASAIDTAAGIFRLNMQTDGNLVLYPIVIPIENLSPWHAYWATNTYGRGDNVTLNFDSDAHLYLVDSTGSNILNLTQGYPTNGSICMMKLDADGMLTLYTHSLGRNDNWSFLWTPVRDRCYPKGFCGFNSFCFLLPDQQPQCDCVPGFSFIDEKNWTSGCRGDFISDRCKSKNGSSSYKIEELSSTEWEDEPYSILSFQSKDGCRQACLEDCNCEAALLRNGQCRKQRLPLRFGRRSTNTDNSYLVFIKVGKSISIGEGDEPTRINRKVGKKTLIIVSVLFAAFGVVTLMILGFAVYKYRVWAYHRISNHNNDNIKLCEEIGPRFFSYAELERMTNGFKEEIGRGSFGTVYKGSILNNQQVVAVKRLERELIDGEKEFRTEMKVIGKTYHKNLVRLLGYCLDGPNRLLVFEYMVNGSLADVIFSPETRPCFAERVEIARNIAKGILYLHEECETQIIHCDIKPQNILMDENMCPKISDFGLAKLLKPNQTKTFTGIRGTSGYLAPEWNRKLPVTAKADVYSFGIVLLEITCCRKNVDQSLPGTEAILEEWVYDCFEAGEIHKLVDDEEVNKKQLERIVRVALWCILEKPSIRPSMKKVLLMLEGTVDIPMPPSPTSFLTTM